VKPVHPLVHQRVAGIENILHRPQAIALFAVENVFAGKHHVVNDSVGTGPLAEQVIALEKRVVTVTGVGDDQPLHGHAVVFHQVRDARV